LFETRAKQEVAMEVDQKHITTIRLHDAKGGDIRLVKQDGDYQLQLSSGSNMVTISLGLADVRKLCQQIVQLDVEETWRTQCVTPPEFRSFFFQRDASYFGRDFPQLVSQNGQSN
jgi:hypothetical protein